MALFEKNKGSRNTTNDEPAPSSTDAPVPVGGTTEPDPGIVESTHVDGQQSVDRAEDTVLPDSKPEEIAPIPDSGTGEAKAPKPAPSSTGYRVAPGKSISSTTGDTIDAGAEIGPDHVGGDEKRLEHLVTTGHVVKTDKTSARDDKSAGQ